MFANIDLKVLREAALFFFKFKKALHLTKEREETVDGWTRWS